MKNGHSRNIGVLILLLVYLWSSQNTIAQTIENIKYSVSDNKINLTYDLVYPIKNAEFNITVFYGNQLNQTEVLVNAKGEFGSKAILPGKGKKVIIEGISPFNPFASNLNFRVVPKLVYIPVNEVTVSGNKFKKGNEIPVRWQGGKSGELIKLTLLKDDKEVYSVEHSIFAFSVDGLREHTFGIKKKVKRGDNYKIQITNSTGKALVSSEFMIRPKVPLSVKIGAVLVVGGIVFILTRGTDNAPEGIAQQSSVPGLPAGAHPGGG